jgi:hypothetical protein
MMVHTAQPDKIVDKKLRDIIVYLTFKTKYLTEIRLTKLIYIAEIYSIEKFGRRLSEINFLSYYYGPWSQEISFAGEMLSGGDILIEFDTTLHGHDASFFKPNVDKPTVRLYEGDLSILDDVLTDWGFKKTPEIIEYAKSTFPYKNSEFGELINFDEHIEESISMIIENDTNIVNGALDAIEEYKMGLGKTFETKENLLNHLQSL